MGDNDPVAALALGRVQGAVGRLHQLTVSGHAPLPTGDPAAYREAASLTRELRGHVPGDPLCEGEGASVPRARKEDEELVASVATDHVAPSRVTLQDQPDDEERQVTCLRTRVAVVPPKGVNVDLDDRASALPPAFLECTREKPLENAACRKSGERIGMRQLEKVRSQPRLAGAARAWIR
jgi:hypothetical protein